MRKLLWPHSFVFSLLVLTTCLVFAATNAIAQPAKVLWWDVSANEPRNKPQNRQRMARYLDQYRGGSRFNVDYVYGPRRGSFAQHMAANPGYRIIVITAATKSRSFSRSDLDALRAFYASGRKTLMLDGTLGIRNSDVRQRTQWPGANNSSANMLVNQMEALRRRGGGLLIGTDHGRFQASANQALQAIVPRARFSRVTNPSRDGQFFGNLLLAEARPVRPFDMLRHWEAIPNQGQAPVGNFKDFQGGGVRLHTLVEASDKPGGGTRRPYISSTINPGQARFDITRNQAPTQDAPAPKPEPKPEPVKEPPQVDKMPTRKGPPRN